VDAAPNTPLLATQEASPIAQATIGPENKIAIYPGTYIKREWNHNTLYFRISVADQNGRSTEINAEHVKIIEGDPVGELPLSHNTLVGMRVNSARELELAATLGIGFIRCASSTANYQEILIEAKKRGIKTLFTHTPLREFKEEKVRKETADLLNEKNMRIDLWEVSNEPDQAVGIIPARYAELFSITREERKKAGRGDIKLVMAAIIPENLPNYLRAMNKKGCVPDCLAFHAYQDPPAINDLQKKIQEILQKKEFTHFPKRLFLTEWGITNNKEARLGVNLDRSLLIDGLEKCLAQKIPVAVHELPDWEGFGLFTPISYEPTPYAWLFKQWVKENPRPREREDWW
jgi:hypothetical protein